ncbi:hypothetical protein ACFYOY_33965 [Streptomyces sp. NPDC007875]|uniref:hypothetical protein n=1 Tax=Streptomyces sp. NPDC007875 TaxID=3364783 RepID=UPI0036A4811B
MPPGWRLVAPLPRCPAAPLPRCPAAPLPRCPAAPLPDDCTYKEVMLRHALTPWLGKPIR